MDRESSGLRERSPKTTAMAGDESDDFPDAIAVADSTNTVIGNGTQPIQYGRDLEPGVVEKSAPTKGGAAAASQHSSGNNNLIEFDEIEFDDINARGKMILGQDLPEDPSWYRNSVNQYTDEHFDFDITRDDETLRVREEPVQRLLLETQLDQMGLYDFVGFEFNVHPGGHSMPVLNPEPNMGGGGGKQGTAGAFVTIIKGFIGIGILSLPFATLKGGYIGAPVGLMIIAYVAHHCMQLLVITSKSVPGNAGNSFGSLGKIILGIWGKRAAEWSLIISQVGFSIAYIIFIGENVADVVCLETKGNVCVTKTSVCLVTAALLLPFSWLPSIGVLVIPIMVANVALLGGICWVYYKAFDTLSTDGMAPNLIAINFSNYPVFFGLAVFTFEGIGLVLPIQRVMKEPGMLPALLKIAMLVLTTLFVSTFFSVSKSVFGAFFCFKFSFLSIYFVFEQVSAQCVIWHGGTRLMR